MQSGGGGGTEGGASGVLGCTATHHQAAFATHVISRRKKDVESLRFCKVPCFLMQEFYSLKSRSVMTRLPNATGTIFQAPVAFEDDSLLGPSYKPVLQELACH